MNSVTIKIKRAITPAMFTRSAMYMNIRGKNPFGVHLSAIVCGEVVCVGGMLELGWMWLECLVWVIVVWWWLVGCNGGGVERRGEGRRLGYIYPSDGSKQYLKPGTSIKGRPWLRCISNVTKEPIHQWIKNKKRSRDGKWYIQCTMEPCLDLTGKAQWHARPLLPPVNKLFISSIS